MNFMIYNNFSFQFLGIEVRSMGFRKWVCLISWFSVEIWCWGFLSYGCFFCFDYDLERLGMVNCLTWNGELLDLEWWIAWLGMVHWLFGTACVCVINLFAMYWTASYKLIEVYEFQLYHFMMHYDHLRFIWFFIT